MAHPETIHPVDPAQTNFQSGERIAGEPTRKHVMADPSAIYSGLSSKSESRSEQAPSIRRPVFQ
jgi:hypothetical protein